MSTLPLPPSTAHVAFDYTLVDVFAERPLEGNQLAIFNDARGLSDAEMQAIARETNLSETTFIFPRSPEIERERGVQVRIFTTQEELPFAGILPSAPQAGFIGTIRYFVDKRRLHSICEPGRFRSDLRLLQQGGQGVFGTMRQNDPVFGAAQDRQEFAKTLQVSLNDLDASLPIQTVSTGNPFCMVPLRSLEAAQSLVVPQNASVQEYLQRHGARFFYFVTPAADEERSRLARTHDVFTGRKIQRLGRRLVLQLHG